MAALAGIGDMPDTITDRAINITMRRRAPGEKVSQFRSPPRRPDPRRHCASGWRHGPHRRSRALSAARPEMPVEDRAADTWEPLIAVADAAGGDWPERPAPRARRWWPQPRRGKRRSRWGSGCSSTSARSSTTRGGAVLALRDSGSPPAGHQESPWNDFDLTVRKLAQRLKGFGIRPGHNTEKTARGYQLEDMYDSFRRYLRPKPSNRPETGDDQW